MDDARPHGWVTMIPARLRGGLGQTLRLPAAPAVDPAAENWPRAEKFGGPPTHVYIFQSVASTSWSVDRGLSVQPRELAEHLIARGHARLAKPHEIQATAGE